MVALLKSKVKVVKQNAIPDISAAAVDLLGQRFGTSPRQGRILLC